MRNLIIFSFLLILVPQLSFPNGQNKYLSIAANKSQAEITAIHTAKNSELDRLEKNANNPSQTNLIAQNQSTSVESQKLIGTATNLKSTANRMISYRHQRHMWVTRDGAIHVLFNQGVNYYGALVLYSSFDGGRSWKRILSIPDTNSTSTADGFLSKQKLFLTYSSSTGKILFLPATYHFLTKKWIFGQATTVYQQKNFIAKNPTIVLDSQGYLWTAFIVQQPSTGVYSIKLFNSKERSLGWNDTYVSLGAIDKSARKSARLVALKDRIGVVYTNDNTFYWAYKKNYFSFKTPWKAQSIFAYQPSSNNTIYSSHFSLVSDPLDNIHLATFDLGKLIYWKFDRQSQNWQPKKSCRMRQK